MRWRDEYLPTCPGCKEIHAARKPPTQPPCETCQVRLPHDLEEAALVFTFCRAQVVTAFDGRPVDIDLTAVKAVMDVYGVVDQRRCMELVAGTFRQLASEGQSES